MNEENILSKLLEIARDLGVVLERIQEIIKIFTMTEVEEKVITAPGFKKLPRDLKKTTLDFNRVHSIVGKKCSKCGGLYTWDYYDEGIKWAVHVDDNGIIIGNGSCPESDYKSYNDPTVPHPPENTELP